MIHFGSTSHDCCVVEVDIKNTVESIFMDFSLLIMVYTLEYLQWNQMVLSDRCNDIQYVFE